MNRFAVCSTAAFLLALTSCSTSEVADSTVAEEPVASRPATTITVEDPAVSFDLPPEAVASSGGGDPRPPAYWEVWNTCAPDNRAAEAEANGGSAAGWYLVDDIIADPGIGLGDHILATCEESVALLEGRTGTGGETNDPAIALAAQLLAAELNLSVGAETCPAADEAVVGAQIVLAAAQFDGVSTSPLDAEVGGALPQLIDLLTAYNLGDLCR